MAQYKVRSGQNIYDVALTLYGSVEGIFDLLASNSWLNMETQLSYGMILNYHEEFAVNKNIVIWLKDNNVLVKMVSISITILTLKRWLRLILQPIIPLNTIRSLICHRMSRICIGNHSILPEWSYTIRVRYLI